MGFSCWASARSSLASWGWAPPPARPTLPTCEVTNTRSPHTIGDDVPRPASEVCHAMFFSALHVVGRRDPENAETRRPAPLRPVLGFQLGHGQNEKRGARHGRSSGGAEPALSYEGPHERQYIGCATPCGCWTSSRPRTARRGSSHRVISAKPLSPGYFTKTTSLRCSL